MEDKINTTDYISYIQNQLESVYETLKMIQNINEDENADKSIEYIKSIKKILTNQIGILVFCIEELEEMRKVVGGHDSFN